MLEIYVDASGNDYPQCPLRSDLNTCEAVEGSEVNDVNSCPSLSEDGEIWNLPDWCPLRDGGVCVQLHNDNWHEAQQEVNEEIKQLIHRANDEFRGGCKPSSGTSCSALNGGAK